MSRKKVPEDEPPDQDETIEIVEPEPVEDRFGVVIEDYVADAPLEEPTLSDKPGPTIELEKPPAASDNEFGVDLSHLTPSARERTLAEMREGARRVGNVPKK